MRADRFPHISAIKRHDNTALSNLLDDTQPTFSRYPLSLKKLDCGTLLHYAAYYDNAAALEMLYSYYYRRMNEMYNASVKPWTIEAQFRFPDVNIFDVTRGTSSPSGIPPSDLANITDCDEVGNLAEGLRADYREQSQALVYGSTPLMVASEYGHVDAVQKLLSLGADVNKQDNIFIIADEYRDLFYQNPERWAGAGVGQLINYRSAYYGHSRYGPRKYGRLEPHWTAVEYALLAPSYRATRAQRIQVLDVLLNRTQARAYLPDTALRDNAAPLGPELAQLTEAYIKYRQWYPKVRMACELHDLISFASTTLRLTQKPQHMTDSYNAALNGNKDALKRIADVGEREVVEYLVDIALDKCKELRFTPQFWILFP